MINPFLTSGYERPGYFCNRNEEKEKLTNAVKNGRHITVFSPRRYGKSGLIHHTFYYLQREKISCYYIDIFGTENLSQFIQQLATNILSEKRGGLEGIIKQAADIFSKVRPSFSFNQLTGMPEMQLNLQTDTEKKTTLNELFNYLRAKKNIIVIAIDEFQQINNYPEKNTEAILRTLIQLCQNVRFVFSGSQKHLLLPMFNDAKRPFYQSTDFLPLQKLDTKDYLAFIKHHFKKTGRNISDTDVEYILDWTKKHTFYTQTLCNKIFGKEGTDISISNINETILNIFEEREPIFLNYRNLLTTQQYRLLKAMAIEDIVTEPTGQQFIRKYNLNNPSTVRKSLQALIDKELVYDEVKEEKTIYQVYDVFLSRWLQHNYRNLV